MVIVFILFVLLCIAAIGVTGLATGTVQVDPEIIDCQTCLTYEQVVHMSCLGGYKFCPDCGHELQPKAFQEESRNK
jgi:rRNA maturation endonuclease Nob1